MTRNHSGARGSAGSRAQTIAVAMRPHGSRRLFAFIAAVLLAFAVLAAFASNQEAYGTERTGALAGRTFEAREARGIALPTGSVVSVTFDDDRVVATAGCNTLLGPATWDGERLVVEGTLASTRMACVGEAEAFESWLGALLQSSPAVTLDGSTLTIGDQTAGLVLQETVAG